MARFDEYAGGAPSWHSAAGNRAAPARAEDDPGSLARTVESEIIPRLLLLHRDDPRCGPEMPPTAAEIGRFTQILLDGDLAEAQGFLAAAQANGASPETLLLSLLAPAARLMGDLWREDLASFAEVTIGLSRLQQMLRGLSAPFERTGVAVFNGRRALLAPTPGEQHSFGLSLVESFLRREGWDVDAAWGASEATLVQAVNQESYDLLGFSLSCDILLDRLASTIHTLRQASRNRMVKVIVGGRYFLSHPEAITQIGADAAALDAKDAAVQSGRLVGLAAPLDW